MTRRLWAIAAVAASVGCASAPRGAPAPRVDLIVAATTDVHGRLLGWDYYAGVADSARGLSRAATIVDSVRAAHPDRVILLDAGDLLQGSPLTYVAARGSPQPTHPVITAMNAMRYDAAAVGNHEFDYGLPALERAIGRADFPFLAANAYLPSGARAFPAYRIVERAGVRVGIVGATTPGAMVWNRDHLSGRVLLRDVVPSVRDAVAEAREKGAEIIVVTIHSGLAGPAGYDTVATGVPGENVAGRLAREIAGIDLVVFGHTHGEVADTVIGTTLFVQPKNWATSVAVARLTLERSGGRWRTVERRGALVRAAGHAESPELTRLLADAHQATVAFVNRAVGTTPVAWRADSARIRDTPLIDFVLEVERRASGADLASAPAYSLEASLDSGPVTVAELARLYPYDNTLRAVRISGRQLRDYLEHSARYYRALPGGASAGAATIDPSIPGYDFDIVSGAEYTIDLRQPVGSRITRLVARGRPVADTDSFTLALHDYRQMGGGGFAMFRDAPVVYDRGVEIRQLLIEEVERRRTIRPETYFTRNWTLEPPEAADAVYAAMHRSSVERQGGPGGPATSGTASREAAPPRTPPPGPRLRLITTNDFHGAFESRSDSLGRRRGGAAYVATAIARARAECAAATGCVSLLLDGGDMFQGTPASNLAFGRTVVDLYNLLDYSAAALGNHEFDWGQDTLRARMRDARFRVLGANVVDTTGRDVSWIPDDTLIDRGGVKVGVIGVATRSTPRASRPVNVAGLRFVDAAPIVDARARALRARGARAVIVIAHAGGFCAGGGAPVCDGEIIDLARSVRERLDAIVSGHTHSFVRAAVNGIPIVQARSRGAAIGVIDLPLGGSGVASVDVREVVTDSLEPSTVVDSLVARVTAAVAERMSQPVTEIASPLRRAGSQFALGNLIADAQRAAVGADIAVMNNGGIRAGLDAGPANHGAFFEVQPFANTLYKLTVNGRALRTYFERLVGGERLNAHVSGVTLRYNPRRPRGSRILSVVMADGRPLRDDATYTLTMNDFMVTGGDGLGLGAESLTSVPTGIVDLDALIAYARTRPRPLRAPTEDRLIIVDAP